MRYWVAQLVGRNDWSHPIHTASPMEIQTNIKGVTTSTHTSKNLGDKNATKDKKE